MEQAIGDRVGGARRRRRRDHHCPREEGFSYNEGWQGEIQQSTVADRGGANGEVRRLQ